MKKKSRNKKIHFIYSIKILYWCYFNGHLSMKNCTICLLSFYFSLLLVIYKYTHTHTHTHIYIYIYQYLIIVVVQSLSHVLLFATPWTAACQAFLSFTISWSLLRLMSIELVMPSNHLILCHPDLQSFLASGSFAVSQLSTAGVWSIGASASASVLLMNIQDWFMVRLTCFILHSKGLSSLLQHHSSKHSQFKSISFKCVSCSNLLVTWNCKSRLYVFWHP